MSDSASVQNLVGDFTSENVPDALLTKVIQDNTLYADVLNAGKMAGTRVTTQEANYQGLIKNHWLFRVLINLGQGEVARIGQIQFGMNIKPVSSIGSMEGRYVGSSRLADSDSSSNVVYSDVDSVNNPPALDSEHGVSAALSTTTASSNSSGGAQSAVFTDISSQEIPAKIPSSDGGSIQQQQPIEGAPFPSVFEVKVRGRSTASFAALVVFRFDLAAGTTFGQLFNALTNRHMEPFMFRKIGVAYFGCRDFISQASALWLRDNIMQTGNGHVVRPDDLHMSSMHIYDLLGWRYSRPRVTANLSDSGDERTEIAIGYSLNNIDRGIWPAEYIHVEDVKLKYNQPVDA